MKVGRVLLGKSKGRTYLGGTFFQAYPFDLAIALLECDNLEKSPFAASVVVSFYAKPASLSDASGVWCAEYRPTDRSTGSPGQFLARHMCHTGI
jgi:hypothetical protein